MIGKTILHYKIIEKLGEGGMGLLYKAEDTKLERTVAIKFLPRHIASNREERKRFEIEAKAAAALNHPNIATIYAIEEVDDEMFIVMEYIEGQELHELVGAGFKPAPTLTLDKIVDYATQIASGLQAAHEKDVTHRDIKSANIMVTGKGQVKIMDFRSGKDSGRGAIHESRYHSWNCCLHVPGTSTRHGNGPPHRHLGVWGCALRNAHGKDAVSG